MEELIIATNVLSAKTLRPIFLRKFSPVLVKVALENKNYALK